jgi:hypothetical protein
MQVKNKPSVVYTVMRLIPWKQSHGSKTRVRSFNFLTNLRWAQRGHNALGPTQR